MGLQRKIRLPGTQFLQNEYLRAGFFPIDPYSSFYALFVANLVSHNSFFLYRPKIQNAHDWPSSLVIPQRGYQQQDKLLIPSFFPQRGYQQQNKLIIPSNFPQPGYQQQIKLIIPSNFSQRGYQQQNKLIIPLNFPQPGYLQLNKLIIPSFFPQRGYL